MRPWTCGEVAYLQGHAHEGTESIARALARSTDSVKAQAHKRGISTRKRWRCPKCGLWSFQPLSPKTGWCVPCTLTMRAEDKAREVDEYEREVARELEQRRRLQALYARKHRAKKKAQEGGA